MSEHREHNSSKPWWDDPEGVVYVTYMLCPDCKMNSYIKHNDKNLWQYVCPKCGVGHCAMEKPFNNRDIKGE